MMKILLFALAIVFLYLLKKDVVRKRKFKRNPGLMYCVTDFILIMLFKSVVAAKTLIGFNFIINFACILILLMLWVMFARDAFVYVRNKTECWRCKRNRNRRR